jgi:hypothetical protein
MNPTSAEAQGMIDAAFRQADRVCIEHLWTPGVIGIPSDRRRILVSEISDRSEIGRMSHYFRIISVGRGGVDCIDYFVIRILKNGIILMEISVFGFFVTFSGIRNA